VAGDRDGITAMIRPVITADEAVNVPGLRAAGGRAERDAHVDRGGGQRGRSWRRAGKADHAY